MISRASSTAIVAACACALFGCRDVDRWSSRDGRYEGSVVAAEFVRSGVAAGTHLCLVLDTTRLQDQPGSITSSDGRFSKTPLVPINTVLHDPLSTLSFGSGRAKNLLFGARRQSGDDGGVGEDLLVVVSLMESGGVEVRLLRPSGDPDAGTTSGVFALFPLEHADGPCSFGSP
jgi:hypothetical protein